MRQKCGKLPVKEHLTCELSVLPYKTYKCTFTHTYACSETPIVAQSHKLSDTLLFVTVMNIEDRVKQRQIKQNVINKVRAIKSLQ